jgi:hypothetical protein
MSDKDKIKEEIKKQIDYAEDDTRYTESYREGLIAAYQTIKAFIDSLPEESGCEVNCTSNDDLEEAAKEYSFNIPTQLDADIVWKKETERHFKDGAKWQLNQMKETLQTEYEKGRFDIREEMMKDAVEGTVKYEIGSAVIPQCDRRYQVLSDPVPIANAKLSDKVKIIILKTK